MAKFRPGFVIALGLGTVILAKVILSIPALPSVFGYQGGAIASEATDGDAEAGSETVAEVGPLSDSHPPPAMDEETLALAKCDAPEVLLRSIQKERDLVDLQQIQMNIRISEIALAKEKLSLEKASLLELKSTLEALLKKVEGAQTEDLARLVVFYKSMKPKDAARIMDDLDIEVTIMVLTAMKPRDAAPVMAKLTPVRARAVSKIIFEQSKLPGDQNLSGIRLN